MGKSGTKKIFDKNNLECYRDDILYVCVQSKDFVHGGLDVLETLGKRTFDVLAEGDHGLKKTLGKAKEKPNLSQVREIVALKINKLVVTGGKIVAMKINNFTTSAIVFVKFNILITSERYSGHKNQ